MPRRKPNLFLIGVMKAGTHHLRKLLTTHPDIFMCEPDEPSYSSNRGISGGSTWRCGSWDCGDARNSIWSCSGRAARADPWPGHQLHEAGAVALLQSSGMDDTVWQALPDAAARRRRKGH